MSKVTFDYSKAASFISEEEVGFMSKLVDNAKKELLNKISLEFILSNLYAFIKEKFPSKQH